MPARGRRMYGWYPVTGMVGRQRMRDAPIITLPVQDAGKFWAHAAPIAVSIFERLAYWNGSMNGQLTIWSAFMGRAMLTVSASSPL